jgi:hypothetical protein
LELGATITYFYNILRRYKKIGGDDFKKKFNTFNLEEIISEYKVSDYPLESNLIRYNRLNEKNKKRFWKYLYDLLWNK